MFCTAGPCSHRMLSFICAVGPTWLIFLAAGRFVWSDIVCIHRITHLHCSGCSAQNAAVCVICLVTNSLNYANNSSSPFSSFSLNTENLLTPKNTEVWKVSQCPVFYTSGWVSWCVLDIKLFSSLFSLTVAQRLAVLWYTLMKFKTFLCCSWSC